MAEDKPATAGGLHDAVTTPICELQPELHDAAHKAVEGAVTITWPYSILRRSLAFVLADLDFRRRRDRGQVRVEFRGAVATAVAASNIGAGDEVRLSLEGVAWEKTDVAGVRRPGSPLEWQLIFDRRLVMQLRRTDSTETETIDIHDTTDTTRHDPDPTPEIPMESPVLEFDAPSPLPTTQPVTPAPYIPKRSADNDEYASPAFVKRARVSYGALFEGGMDIFEEGQPTKRQKRSRFSMNSSWRYSSRSPSPEAEPEADEEEPPVLDLPTEQAATILDVDQPMTDQGSQTLEQDLASHDQPAVVSELDTGATTTASVAPRFPDGMAEGPHVAEEYLVYHHTPTVITEPLDTLDTRVDAAQTLAFGFEAIQPASYDSFSTVFDEERDVGASFATLASDTGANIFSQPTGGADHSLRRDEVYGHDGPSQRTDLTLPDEEPRDIEGPADPFTLNEEPHSATPIASVYHSLRTGGEEPPQPQASLGSKPDTIQTRLDRGRSTSADPLEISDDGSSVGESSPVQSAFGRGSIQPEPRPSTSQEPQSLIESGSLVNADDEDDGDLPEEDYNLRKYAEAQDDDDEGPEASDLHDSRNDELSEDEGREESGFDDLIENGQPEEDQESEKSDMDDDSELSQVPTQRPEATRTENPSDEAIEPARHTAQVVAARTKAESWEDADDQEVEEEDEEYSDDLADNRSPRRTNEGQAEYDTYYDEDDEEPRSDEGEDEEDDEEEAPGPARRPVSGSPGTPVFISLLSDSEDDDAPPPKPAAQAVKAPKSSLRPDDHPTYGRKSISQMAAQPDKGTSDEIDAEDDDLDDEDGQKPTLQIPAQSDEDMGDVYPEDEEKEFEDDELDDNAEDDDDESSRRSVAMENVLGLNDQDDAMAVDEESTHETDGSVVEDELEAEEGRSEADPSEPRDPEPQSEAAVSPEAASPSGFEIAAGTVDDLDDFETSNVTTEINEVTTNNTLTDETPIVLQETITHQVITVDHIGTVDTHDISMGLPVGPWGRQQLADVAMVVDEIDQGSLAVDPALAASVDAVGIDVAVSFKSQVEAEPLIADLEDTQSSDTSMSTSGQKTAEDQTAPELGPVVQQEASQAELTIDTVASEVEVSAELQLDINQLATPTEAHETKEHEEAAQSQAPESNESTLVTRDEEVAVNLDSEYLPEVLVSNAVEETFPSPSSSPSVEESDDAEAEQQLLDEHRDYSLLSPQEDAEEEVDHNVAEPALDHELLTLVEPTESTEPAEPAESIEPAKPTRTPRRRRKREVTPVQLTSSKNDSSLLDSSPPAMHTRSHDDLRSRSPSHSFTQDPTAIKKERTAKSAIVEDHAVPPSHNTRSHDGRRATRSVSRSFTKEKTPLDQDQPAMHTRSHDSPEAARTTAGASATTDTTSPAPAESADKEQPDQIASDLMNRMNSGLGEFVPLSALRGPLLGKTIDIMAIAAITPSHPRRPKNGPRDFALELNLIDPSTQAKGGIVAVQIFRQHVARLPDVVAGDVVFLRQFQVIAMRGRGFGVKAGDASAWAVFEKADPELPQIKGMPVEMDGDERDYADGLRRWCDGLGEDAWAEAERAAQRAAAEAIEARGESQ